MCAGLEPPPATDESQNRAVVVSVLLLGQQSSHQRAVGMTTPSGQRSRALPVEGRPIARTDGPAFT